MRSKGINWSMLCLCLRVVAVSACAGQSPPHLALRVLESQVQSGIDEPQLQFMVISDQAHFTALYHDLHQMTLPRPAVPDVDLTSRYVLVAFMGQKSTAGYAIRFGEKVVKRHEAIEVTVYQDTPTEGAMLAQMMTSPYVMATVDRDAYTQVRFVDEEGHVLDEIGVK
jgi:hypothetical protein